MEVLFTVITPLLEYAVLSATVELILSELKDPESTKEIILVKKGPVSAKFCAKTTVFESLTIDSPMLALLSLVKE